MRPRFGRSLFSLALLVFIIGITIKEDFWTNSPTDEEPAEEQVESELAPGPYNHDRPRVNPLDLEEVPLEEETSTLSLLVIQDTDHQQADLSVLTYDPNQHTVFVSKRDEVSSIDSTDEMIKSIQDQVGYLVQYYVRLDKKEMESVMEKTLENPAMKDMMEQVDAGSTFDGEEAVDVGGLVSDMTKMSFLTLLSLKQLATDVSKQVETNLSVAELLTLRDEIGMDNLLKPLQIKQGPTIDTVPTFHSQ